jgi:peptidoglycan-N-acetylglucosamine deacetylase
MLCALGETHATFFVWGEQGLAHSGVVSDVLRSGHSVQPHCWRHIGHENLDAAEIRADIDRVSSLLAELGAPRPTLWRPPWGRLRKPDSRRIAAERGLELVGWTVDSHDWAGQPGDELYADVKAQIAAARADVVVVLMHDSCVEAIQATHRSDCGATVELVRRLIDDEELVFTPLLHGLADNLKEERDLPATGTEPPSPG